MISAGADPTNVVGRRAVAFLLDSFLAFLVSAFILYLIGISFYIPGPIIRGSQTQQVNPAAILPYMAAYLCYALATSVVTVAKFGWTPGKLMMGVRIVGWDGHPPGLGRSFARALLRGLLDTLQCLYWVAGFAIMSISKGHKSIPDMAAGTFVIDATYLGRQIIEVGGKIGAGGRSASQEEIQAVHEELAALTGVHVPPGKKATEPFYDKERDTYVVYSQKQEGWMQLDKMSGQWTSLQ